MTRNSLGSTRGSGAGGHGRRRGGDCRHAEGLGRGLDLSQLVSLEEVAPAGIDAVRVLPVPVEEVFDELGMGGAQVGVLLPRCVLGRLLLRVVGITCLFGHVGLALLK